MGVTVTSCLLHMYTCTTCKSSLHPTREHHVSKHWQWFCLLILFIYLFFFFLGGRGMNPHPAKKKWTRASPSHLMRCYKILIVLVLHEFRRLGLITKSERFVHWPKMSHQFLSPTILLASENCFNSSLSTTWCCPQQRLDNFKPF